MLLSPLLRFGNSLVFFKSHSASSFLRNSCGGIRVDGRSNMFSLGAILYEMVTETKAFPGDDAEQVRQAIHEFTPPAPAEINSKIHPALSEVIMKALAKSPEERYQSGQDLVNDLERCKESAPRKEARKSAAPAKGLNVPQAAKPAASASAQKKSAVAAPAAHQTGKSANPGQGRSGGCGMGKRQPLNPGSPKPPKEVQRHRKTSLKLIAGASQRAGRSRRSPGEKSSSRRRSGNGGRGSKKEAQRPQLFRNQRTASAERNLHTTPAASGSDA